MHACVLSDLALALESTRAARVRTGVRFLPRVLAHVDGQICFLIESFCATWILADKRVRVGVNELMAIQICSSLESFAATRPLTLERAITRMHAHMIVELFLIRKEFSATIPRTPNAIRVVVGFGNQDRAVNGCLWERRSNGTGQAFGRKVRAISGKVWASSG
mgnify:CR=1 FL=1